MLLIKKIIPFATAAFIGLIFEIWILAPKLTYEITAAAVLVTFIALYVLAGQKLFSVTLWNNLPTPLAFIISMCSFFLLIDHPVVQHIYIAGSIILYGLALNNIFAFLYHTEKYQPYALENIYGYLNLVSVFLFIGTFYGISLLFGVPFVYCIIPIGILASFIFARTLWSYKIPWRVGRLHIFVVGLLTAETAFAVSQLPTSYVFNAFIVSIVYYLAVNISKDQLRDTVSFKRVRLYFIVGGIALALAAVTTKWI
ncbi:MAG: hypothetical protein PHY34_01245 [Patescibacteria group bacterium]|nr:hypothetical protein [Patescibacteria group bacterium]MDD5715156.1 hypothetical protein [Patescibacteria group bacterium]